MRRRRCYVLLDLSSRNPTDVWDADFWDHRNLVPCFRCEKRDSINALSLLCLIRWNFRSRKCLDESGTAKIALLPDEFGNGTDAKSAVIDNPSCDLDQLEEVTSCFVGEKCPSKCCSRIELIVEKESGQKNLQVHRNGIYYQRLVPKYFLRKTRITN